MANFITAPLGFKIKYLKEGSPSYDMLSDYQKALIELEKEFPGVDTTQERIYIDNA